MRKRASSPSSALAAGGCLSGVLRSFLCRSVAASVAGEAGEDNKSEEMSVTAPAQSPGVVARLMGLDTMPPPAALTRSRSTNSDNDRSAGAPPRLRTSASFRETPTFLRQENDEFLLLSFVPDDGGGGDRSAKSKIDIAFDAKKRQSAESNAEESPVAGGSHNSSPISVLDAPELSKSIDQEPCSPPSGDEEKPMMPRRKLYTDSGHPECPFPPQEARRAGTAVQRPDVSEICRAVDALVSGDLKLSRWTAEETRRQAAKFAVNFGVELLDQLVLEALVELLTPTLCC